MCNEIRMCHPDVAFPIDSNAEKSTMQNSTVVNGGATGGSVKQVSVSTDTMSAVADVLDSLWTLLSWLDRPPFNNNTNNQQHYYVEFKKTFCDIGLQLATSAQRDTFAENPVKKILDCCARLDQLSDTLIREVNDALILQPASLDIATVRRRSNSHGCDDADFGITFEPFPLGGVHVINAVRFQSPAHQCDRIHPGDEVVQINYQTVVGWTLTKVSQLMEENPSEMIVTLKKRPRHLPYVIPYMKPIRISASARTGYHNQSKKGSSGRSGGNGGFFNNLPSPRAELLVAPNITLKISKAKDEPNEITKSIQGASLENICHEKQSDSDSIDEDDDPDDTFLPPGCNSSGSGGLNSSSIGRGGSITGVGAIGLSPSKSPTQSVRSLLSRPRATPQRRATISGSSPSICRPYINISEVNLHQASRTVLESFNCNLGLSNIL